MRFLLGTLVLVAGLSAQTNAPIDPVRIVVSCLTAATAVHVRRDYIHLSGQGCPDLCGVDVFKGPARRHETMPLDVGVPEAPQLFFKPVDRIAIALRSLHSIPELRQSFDVRLVPFQFKAADDGAHRVWRRVHCLGRKPRCPDQRSKQETHKSFDKRASRSLRRSTCHKAATGQP